MVVFFKISEKNHMATSFTILTILLSLSLHAFSSQYCRIKQHLSITASSPNSLHILFCILWWTPVNNCTNVKCIDPHTKCDCGNNYSRLRCHRRNSVQDICFNIGCVHAVYISNSLYLGHQEALFYHLPDNNTSTDKVEHKHLVYSNISKFYPLKYVLSY